MARIEMESLNKVYPNKVHAVKDFDLMVENGSFTTLVGPSGCGKTTLLRMIAGLERSTSGKIKFDGKEVSALSPKQRNVSMVFQSNSLFPNKTIYENMAIGLQMRKVPKRDIDRKVRSAAEMLNISSLLGKMPNEISGGERQRGAIVRAIVKEPNVFLFDEPLSNLDAKLKARMRHELRALQKQLKGTFVYVTHDQTEAMSMSDRLVVMNHGVLEQEGVPLDLYDHPVSIFVAGFLGSSEMNFIDCVIKRTDKGLIAYNDDLSVTFPYSPELEKYIGVIVVMGIRPEHIKLGGETAFEVISTENLGSDSYLRIRRGALDLTVKASDVCNSVLVLNFAFPPEHLHFFDKITGKAIY